ncbi:MAG: phage portal protein [Mogibacterium sp.]|nr:phage portal protein [Clostridia bacterium]MBR0307619.1 phage portal protein [Mogibacterium sp.]
MGIFDNLFGRRPAKRLQTYFSTLTAYSPVWTTIQGGLYEAESTRDAINAVATHFSKFRVVIKGGKATNKALATKLKTRPNPWQSTSQWLYRTATILLVENNAFVVPILDDKDISIVNGLYTVLPSRCELMDYKGEAWLRYTFSNGEVGAIELARCAVLTGFQYKDDFFGSQNDTLFPTLQLIHTQEEGISEGIKASASVRFIGRLGNTYDDDTIDDERKRFREKNFAAENAGGLVLVDGKYEDIKQITSKPYIVDADQMELINHNIHNHFGVNEKILRNEWDEANYTAFYEGKLEPMAIQMAQGLTNMLFTDRECATGNEIQLSADRLVYATTAAKRDLIRDMLDRGVFSRNDAREILQMDPIPGGDNYVIRGEYVNAAEKINGGNDNAD